MSADPIERVRGRLARKAAAMRLFLLSPVGQDIMAVLEEEFLNGPLFVADPYQTAFNLGGREVVVYLKQLQKIGDRTDAAT